MDGDGRDGGSKCLAPLLASELQSLPAARRYFPLSGIHTLPGELHGQGDVRTGVSEGTPVPMEKSTHMALTTGTPNAETLYGTEFDDVIKAHDGNDTVYGGARKVREQSCLGAPSKTNRPAEETPHQKPRSDPNKFSQGKYFL